MNERIRELFDRAEHQALKHLGSDWEVYVEPSREQIFEKFAELIVRECADRLMGSDFNDFKGVMYIAGLRLKEHFGLQDVENVPAKNKPRR